MIFASVDVEGALLLLKAAFLVLLYLFIWRIVRSAARDLRLPQESMILSPQQAAQLLPQPVAKELGRIVVVDAPHYVVVGDDGTFTFKSLAPGKYKLQAWNERSGEPTTTTLVIKEGANETKVDLAASTPTNTDKFGVVRK